MTTTKFILDSRARQADGRAALKISVSKMGATSYITTGVSLFPEEWDVKKGRVVKHPQKKMMNLVIQQRKVQFDAVLYRLTMEGRLARAWLSLRISRTVCISSCCIKKRVTSEFYPKSNTFGLKVKRPFSFKARLS